MMYMVLMCAAGIVGLTVWMVSTYKVQFPLLFDLGLTTIALGIIVWADGYVIRAQPVNSGVIGILAGLLILGASYLREKKKRRKSLRTGPPRELDGRHIHNITGGKQ